MSETLSTLITRVWHLSSVNFHVFIKVSFMSQTLSTLITRVWFLSSMNMHVFTKVSFMSETLPTLKAGERFVGYFQGK